MARSSSDPTPKLHPAVVQTLHTLFDSALAQKRVPGGVALVTTADSTLYRRAWGAQDARGIVPMRMESVFRIMSMTKPITSVGIMLLQEAGDLDLDDPVTAYLPEFRGREVLVSLMEGSIQSRPARREVTLRHLLSHTAGFAYAFSHQESRQLAELTGAREETFPLLHDPGDQWCYGVNTRVLGRVIETITGSRLSSFFKNRIFEPLGMMDTSFDPEEFDPSRLAALHRRSGDTLSSESFPEDYTPREQGDGGLLSTAEDYGRFLRMLLGMGQLNQTQLLRESSVREMGQNQIGDLFVVAAQAAVPSLALPFPKGAGVDKFGLGFQISATQQAGLRAPGSLSWGGLYNTHFWVDGKRGVGALFLTQLLPYYDNAVMDLLLDFERAIYSRPYGWTIVSTHNG